MKIGELVRRIAAPVAMLFALRGAFGLTLAVYSEKHGAPWLGEGSTAPASSGQIVQYVLFTLVSVGVVIALIGGSVRELLRPGRRSGGGAAGGFVPLVRTALLAAVAITGVSLLISLSVAGELAPGETSDALFPAVGIAAVWPGLPLLALYLRRWQVRWRRPAVGSRPSRSHAPLPPSPRQGAAILPGQVWEVDFPFEEGSGSKRRPALIIRAGAGKVLVLKITSQDKSAYPAHYARVDNARWRAMNSQGKASWLQLDRPAEIAVGRVLRPLGVCAPRRLWDAVVGHHRIAVPAAAPRPNLQRAPRRTANTRQRQPQRAPRAGQRRQPRRPPQPPQPPRPPNRPTP
jgi:hypothetical protein